MGNWSLWLLFTSIACKFEICKSPNQEDDNEKFGVVHGIYRWHGKAHTKWSSRYLTIWPPLIGNFRKTKKALQEDFHTVLDAYVQFLKQQSKLDWINLGNQCFWINVFKVDTLPSLAASYNFFSISISLSISLSWYVLISAICEFEDI